MFSEENPVVGKPQDMETGKKMNQRLEAPDVPQVDIAPAVGGCVAFNHGGVEEWKINFQRRQLARPVAGFKGVR